MKKTTEMDKKIGSQLRFLREANGFNQAFIGKKIGVSYQQIQKYETGVNRISASTLYKLAFVLGAEINDFFMDYEIDTQPDHIKFLKLCRKMNKRQLKSITNIVKVFAKEGK